MGENGLVSLSVKSANATEPHIIKLPIANYLSQSGQDPLLSLGFTPYQPPIKPIIGDIVPDSPAAKQGLQVGDTVVVANNQAITTWQDFVEVVRTHPEQAISTQVERQGKVVNLTLTPRMERDQVGTKEGKLGIGVKRQPFDIPPQYIQKQDYNCSPLW